jgi:membrane dipeptidase
MAVMMASWCALSACTVPTRTLHEQVLTLDSHLDTPSLFGLAGWDFAERHRVEQDGSQLDIPRMIEGGLDGGFFATYIPQGELTDAGRAAARAAAHTRLDEIHAMVKRHGELAEIALTAADARRIAASGRRVVFLSMENGYPVGNHPDLLAEFHARGVRMAGPVHFLNNDLGTSSTDVARPVMPGLTAAGREWLREANRLGILVDASHASDAVLDDLLEFSTRAIVLSHSGARAVFDHPRNVDDDHLRRIAARGGVVQVSAYPDYLLKRTSPPERSAEIARIRQAGAGDRTAAGRRELTRRLAEVDRRWPVPRATYEQFVAHLLHVIRIAGVEHAGIGIDFDGGGGVEGFADATAYPQITASLRRAGLTDREIGAVWSGNLLRVLAAAQCTGDYLSGRCTGR